MALGVLNSRVQLVPIHSETCRVPQRVNKVNMLECMQPHKSLPSQTKLCSCGPS